jgi:hypothetical protein
VIWVAVPALIIAICALALAVGLVLELINAPKWLDERDEVMRLYVRDKVRAVQPQLPRVPPTPDFDQNERVQLQARWQAGTAALALQGVPTEVCPDCFQMHGGICPRIAEITTERKGTTITTTKKYWPNDKWAPPLEALSGSTIFAGPAPQQPQGEPHAPEAEISE